MFSTDISAISWEKSQDTSEETKFLERYCSRVDGIFVEVR